MRKIWTIHYRPFIMGGDVNRAISTDVEPIEVRKIKGFEFFTFKTPKGTTKLAEAQTGGIIADDFDDLLEAIKGCNKSFLKGQIDDAIKFNNPENSQHLDNNVFFSHYKY